MKFDLSYIACLFRSCACCKLDFYFYEWLCPKCQTLLKNNLFKIVVHELDSDITFFGLCDWNNKNYDLILKLILTLKGNYNQSGWRFIADQFIKNLILKSRFPDRDAVLIPAPYTDVKRKHSHLLANEVGKLLQLTVDTSLLSYKAKKLRQTSLSKTRRADIKIQSNKHKYKNIIIVDDVCTTGSTIRASKKALMQAGSGKIKFEAWGFTKRL